MKKILFLYLTLGMHLFTNAQETTVLPSKKLKSIYFEAGGRAIYGSFNYEQTLKNYKNGYLTGSVGASLLPISSFFNWAVPINVKYIFGTNNHHLELGLGATFHAIDVQTSFQTIENGNPIYIKYFDNYKWLYLTPSVGYRFQKPTNGILFSINFIPLVGLFEQIDSKSKNSFYNGQTTWFKKAAFFPLPIMPWAGFSIGYCFK
jgi:hypothetical protein